VVEDSFATAERKALAAAIDAFAPQAKQVMPAVDWIMGDGLNTHLWSKQREIADSVQSFRYTAVPASHGVGKSFIASRLVSWWISSYPVGEAFAVTTAPTNSQVSAILWRELRRAHAQGGLAGRLTLDNRWLLMGPSGEELVAWGRKPADADMEAFQGIHARHCLVVLDEAAGIPQTLYDAADTLATSQHSRVLAIGNPDDPRSPFATACKAGSGWNVVPVSAFDCPAFTGEQIPLELKDLLVTETWVAERAARWGVKSSMYISRVLGQFPAVAEDLVFPPDLLSIGTRTFINEAQPQRLGVDIARSGTDMTVVYSFRGGRLRKEWEHQGYDLMRTVGAIRHALFNTGTQRVVVDATGMGAGVFDRLRELGIDAVPFYGGARARQPRRFANRRAEGAWELREMIRDGMVDLDPDDDQLLADLGLLAWEIDSSQRIVLESKDALRSRGLSSPDHADAAIYAAAGESVPDAEAFLRAVRTPANKSLTSDLLRRAM
jgi:hypothetical protein